MASKKKKIDKDNVEDFMVEVLGGLDLTQKEQDLVLRYLHSYNARQAVMEVYGCNKHSAGTGKCMITVIPMLD